MRKAVCLAATFLLNISILMAQEMPRLTNVKPTTAKVGDTVTVVGENLGKERVVAVFLSDAESDYQMEVIEQTAGKIIFKVAQVKQAIYRVALGVGDQVFIQPVRLTVKE